MARAIRNEPLTLVSITIREGVASCWRGNVPIAKMCRPSFNPLKPLNFWILDGT